MKAFVTIILVFAALSFMGCDNDHDRIVYQNVYIYDESDAPPVPQGVYSVTRDQQVLLYWLPIDDINGDFSKYIVYRSNHPDTGYWSIGETTIEYFFDNGVQNGETYYYAISSIDYEGNLSALSYEYVFDTPRPEGINRMIFDYNTAPNFSGWSLAGEQSTNFQSPSADFYLEYFAGDDVFYLNVASVDTDIQDMGFTSDLDEIDYSPEFGWSQNGWVEVVWGHTYVIWTEDNHFAKVRVTSINNDNIIFDWAYQVDTGNMELKIRPKRMPGYLRNSGDGS